MPYIAAVSQPSGTSKYSDSAENVIPQQTFLMQSWLTVLCQRCSQRCDRNETFSSILNSLIILNFQLVVCSVLYYFMLLKYIVATVDATVGAIAPYISYSFALLLFILIYYFIIIGVVKLSDQARPMWKVKFTSA